MKSKQVEEAFTKGAQIMNCKDFDEIWEALCSGKMNDKFLRSYIHEVAISYAETANRNIEEAIKDSGRASAMTVDYINDLLSCDLNLPYKIDDLKNSRL